MAQNWIFFMYGCGIGEFKISSLKRVIYSSKINSKNSQ